MSTFYYTDAFSGLFFFWSVKTSFRDYDVDFARGVVNSCGSTFGRIAVCVKLTAESACLFGGALSGIEIHEIPAGTDRLVPRVALGVKRLRSVMRTQL